MAENLTNQGNGASKKERRSRRGTGERVQLLTGGTDSSPRHQCAAAATPTFQLDFLFGNLTKSFPEVHGKARVVNSKVAMERE